MGRTDENPYDARMDGYEQRIDVGRLNISASNHDNERL
jgi:hypothetical protein